MGSIEDLSAFPDRTFDVVLCLDAPPSLCADTYETALDELVRVAKNALVLCVFNRIGVILEDALDFDLAHYGALKTILEDFKTGTLRVTEDMKKLQPGLLPTWHAFHPPELVGMLERRRRRVERVSAPGTLARSLPAPRLLQVLGNEHLYRQYLDFEEQISADPGVRGVGTVGGGGLLVTARKD